MRCAESRIAAHVRRHDNFTCGCRCTDYFAFIGKGSERSERNQGDHVAPNLSEPAKAGDRVIAPLQGASIFS